MRAYEFYVYILANKRNGTLYIGVSNDLSRRLREHRDITNPKSFTAKYKTSLLVYYEFYTKIFDALYREKQLKHWNRRWKKELIETMNPIWLDLSCHFDV